MSCLFLIKTVCIIIGIKATFVVKVILLHSYKSEQWLTSFWANQGLEWQGCDQEPSIACNIVGDDNYVIARHPL